MKRTPRLIPTPTDARRLTPRDIQILSALQRYRYLDSKHIFELIDCHNSNGHVALRRLFDFGLIYRIPNNKFGRDRLKDPQVYEITQEGKDQLSQRGVIVYRVDWLKGGTYKNPVHNLNLCLALCSIELACLKAGLRFIPWGEILERAPTDVRTSETPYNFGVGIIPDAIFSIEYPNHFMAFAFELDLTAHGEKEYTRKFERYDQLIFQGIYKKHLAMKQRLVVLTITTNDRRRDNMMKCVPKRTDPYYFQVQTSYGAFDKAPQPALSILEGWKAATTKNFNNLGDEAWMTA